MPYLKASAGCILVLDPDLLSPKYYDYDFTHVTDDGKTYERGGCTYARPYGWNRHALNVSQKYGDNVWLGGTGGGIRTESTPGEWPVSFHGTKKDSVPGIAKQGYLLSMSKREVYGRGLYSSPSIEVAELYAGEFSYRFERYKVVFQNRVNPDGMKTIAADRIRRDRGCSDVKGDYWLQPREDYIRPYAICSYQEMLSQTCLCMLHNNY